MCDRPTVVLVDDEPDIITVLGLLLQRRGFEVVGSASDGEAALTVVTSTAPDAVLLDLQMPKRDGASVLPELVAGVPATMIAVLSANVEHFGVDDLFRLGAFAAYTKGDLRRLPDALLEDLAAFRTGTRADEPRCGRFRRL